MRGSRRLAAVAGLLLLTGCSGEPGTAEPATQGQANQGQAQVDAAEEQVPPPAAATDASPTADPRSTQSDLAAAAEEAARAAGAPTALPTGEAHPQVLGGDVSWPQCPVGLGIPEKRSLGLPPPLPTARFVVIGLTNGPGFTPNPCLAEQVADARSRDLLTAAYAVVSYPSSAQVDEHGTTGPFDATTPAGLLRNTGYQQARYAVEQLVDARLATPVVWLDVESVPGFDWSADPQANAAVVEGAARGYREAGYRVGVYSTPALWQRIVGGLTLGAAEWRPAGPSTQVAAQARCGADWSVQGGSAVLVQWVEQQRDVDVTCPSFPGRLGDWFDPS